MADPNARTAVDMAAARKATTFDVDKVHGMLNEGSRDPTLRTRLVDILKREPTFDKLTRPYVSRAERLDAGLALTNRLLQLTDEHDWDYMEFLEALSISDEHIGLYLHEIAFQPVVQAQGSDEQHETWLQSSQDHAILGCYAQTELGHGSNVQQLETIATYLPKTQEFEIHSPTVTSTKWWIGALGLLATHAVVQARLILGGQDKGPHLFIVPLRDMKTHKTLPGIELGEIGPKVHGAFAALDNGFARFDRVKVPREHMLNRFASVSASGEYSSPVHSKASYGGMVFIRANLIGKSGWSLAKGITIALRYLTVRRQFGDPEVKGSQERQVLHYPSVFHRVLPLLGEAYAFITVSKDMLQLYLDMANKLAGGDTELLAETHAVSSGLKSYVTAHVVDGCETARRAMGGHGFLESAGVGRIFAAELPSCTYEGDNYILALQVARAALKTYRSIATDPSAAEKLTPSTAYLSTLVSRPATSTAPAQTPSTNWTSLPSLTDLLDRRAAQLVQRLAKRASGTAWSELSWECQPVSRAVVESFLARSVATALKGKEGLLVSGLGETETSAVSVLMHFYVLNLVENATAELLEFGLVKPGSELEGLREAHGKAARAVLPHVIGLTDAFGFTDWELDSTLGRKDGKVYEALLENARRTSEANLGKAATEGYLQHIKPILARGAKKSGGEGQAKL